MLLFVGAFLLFAGAVDVRDTSNDHRPRRYWIRYEDDPQQHRVHELQDMLETHRICTESGTWDQWPCDQWTPPSE